MTLRVVEAGGEKRRLEGFTPPEGVPIAFTIASAGTRLGAQLLDLMLTIIVIVAVVIFLIYTRVLDPNAALTLVAILVFLTRVPYYVLTELVWNGRTVGKRMTGIRVISADGRRLRPSQVVARNMMKEAEFLAPLQGVFAAAFASGATIVAMLLWVIVVAVFFLANKRRQRLGDVIAGTLVVQQPKARLLPDLSLASAELLPAQAGGFSFLPAQLDIYGRHELEVLENVLRNGAQNKETQQSVRQVARAIIGKIDYTDPVRDGDEMEFLRAFYTAQRAHLEQLRLFGNARENKFHAKGGQKSGG